MFSMYRVSPKKFLLKSVMPFRCSRFRTIATLNRLMCYPDLLIVAIVRNWVSKIFKGTFFGTYSTLFKHILTPPK